MRFVEQVHGIMQFVDYQDQEYAFSHCIPYPNCKGGSVMEQRYFEIINNAKADPEKAFKTAFCTADATGRL